MSHRLLEPFTRAWLEDLLSVPGPDMTALPVDQARLAMREGQGETPNDARISLKLHRSPEMDFYLLRPVNAVGPLPVLVYFHGGGWVLGDIETHKRLVQQIVRSVGCALVFPEYPRAPESPFPRPVEATFAFLQWISENGTTLNLDTRRLAVAGDSSGGNLAAVLAVLAVSRGGPAICSQVLLYPVTDCDFARTSYADFGKGFFLDASLMEWFWGQYVPDANERLDPRACPLRTPLSQLAGVAPALIITAECDILSEEGEEYGLLLAQAGVPVTMWRAFGTVHSFLLANGLSASAPAERALYLLSAHLRQALGC